MVLLVSGCHGSGSDLQVDEVGTHRKPEWLKIKDTGLAGEMAQWRKVLVAWKAGQPEFHPHDPEGRRKEPVLPGYSLRST